MGRITWNTDVNAPCCPGEIVNDDGRTLLIQTDWDYCGTARSFGWDMRTVQAGHAGEWDCSHDGTDGTVDCPHCPLKASAFMEAAHEWLRDNDGATADDPGYFQDNS